jgi:hypothetical protein
MEMPYARPPPPSYGAASDQGPQYRAGGGMAGGRNYAVPDEGSSYAGYASFGGFGRGGAGGGYNTDGSETINVELPPGVFVEDFLNSMSGGRTQGSGATYANDRTHGNERSYCGRPTQHYAQTSDQPSYRPFEWPNRPRRPSYGEPSYVPPQPMTRQPVAVTMPTENDLQRQWNTLREELPHIHACLDYDDWAEAVRERGRQGGYY